MALRTQKTGRQIPWSEEDLKDGLLHFFNEHKRYPTASEIDEYPHLPSARTIERSHQGLVSLRKKLGLGSEYDYRAGSHSSKRAKTINSRAHKIELEVYEFLTKKFGIEFVHREYFFTDDKRTRADFFVHDSNGGFCVDVFYPSTIRNLSGCINNKLMKYRPEIMQQYPVIFLQMNPEIDQDTINHLMGRKKKGLGMRQKVFNWESFKSFCGERRALTIEREG